MWRFKVIEEYTKGDVNIASNTQFNSINADNIILNENVSARLYGSVKNSITLKKGSKLYLHGKFEGELHNEGGEIFIY